MNTNRYFVFSKNTWKTKGAATPIKKFATREDARAYKRIKNKLGTWGIWDTHTDSVVR